MKSKRIEMIPVIIVFFLLATVVMGGQARAANTWESIGPSGARVWALAIDPTNPSVLYAATSGGLYKSDNAGGIWTMNTGLGSTYVSSIAINPDNTLIIYVGISTGMQKSTDGGATWNPFNSGITNTAFKSIVIDPSAVTTLYVATYGGGVFKSSGGDWIQVITGLTDLNVNALVINPVTPAVLYAGTDGGGVFRSLNNGATWVAVNTGLADKYIYTLAIDPSTPSTIYAGTYDGGVFKSIDSGGNWNEINTELTNKYVRALAINPESTSLLYAGTYGGVFKGSGGSGHWNMVNDGLANVNIKALAVDPVSPATVYAGTDGNGVFKTTFGNFTLTTGFTGTGRGTVTSDPPGMACGSGCSHPFEFATYVTLTGTPLDYSTFDGWTGACFGISSCELLMDADRTVGAIFNLDTTHKALIPYPSQYFYFSTLQAAYNAATSVWPVMAWGTDFTEDLNAADAGNKAVTLKGGYNGAYTANSGYTTLHGSLTVAKGSLTVEQLVIR